MLSWGKLLPSNGQGIFRRKKLGFLVLMFCPPQGGVPSAMKFLTPSELPG